jgi:leucyl-tRNA synthetase
VFEDIEDVTINYEEDGVQVIQELDKEIISRGAWATVLFRYRQWERSREGYGPDRYTLRRYRRTGGEYRQQAKFNISSVEQARRIVEVLSRWIAEAEEQGMEMGEEEE